MSLRRILQKKKQHLAVLLVLATVLCVFYALTLSSVTLALGNLFFGRSTALYNVNLASFFYTHASYPLSGKEAEYAHYQLGRTYFIKGKLQAARNETQKELELFPENKKSYYMLGLTYGYMNEEKKAIEAFSIFIESNPDSWAARNDKAWLQFRIGDIDGALSTMEPISHDIDNPWIQNTYGTLLMNKKRYHEAKEAFLNAKKAADATTEQAWGRAYPGNDPRIYGTGLSAMRRSIESNLELLKDS